VKDAWVRSMVQQRDDVVLIDAAILGPPQVFEASAEQASAFHNQPLTFCSKFWEGN
jgi:glycyl-tRNA synthetase